MKKRYINPEIRVINVECDSLMALSLRLRGGDATDNPALSRGHRYEDDEDEYEDEEEDW